MQIYIHSFYRLWFILLFATVPHAYSQGEFYSKNLKHYYDLDAEIRIVHKVVNFQGKTLLFLKLTINHDRTRIEDLITTYGFINNYSQNIVMSNDTIKLNNHWISNQGNSHYLNFDLMNPEINKILIIKISNKVSGNDFYFDILVDPEAKYTNSGIILEVIGTRLPFFRNYTRENEDFELVNLKTNDSVIYVFRYTSDFTIADPPFSSSNKSIIKSIEIDSTFTIRSRGDTLNLSKKGLYFAQYDTTGVNGLAFRVEGKYFPRSASYDELIASLTYFTTRSEMDKLTSAKNQKLAFDKYWIEITKSADRAKRIIREYYLRIKLANELFTSYKQGWKTDKGMIFVIYGPPDEVLKDGDREEWIYARTNQLPRINFTFAKSRSIFTNDHYVLLRKKSYQQIWYKAIDLWRKGQMEL